MGKLIKILAGIVVILVIIVVALPFIVDPNDYRDEIVSAVEKSTGRTLTIDGDLNLTVFPWAGIDTGKLSLGNAKGFADKPFAAVDDASVRIKLLPLLSGKIVADTITLNGLNLNLAINKQGIGNWADLSAPAEQKKPEKAETRPADLSGLTIGGININHASISWQDDSTGQSYLVDNLRLNTGAIVPGDPVDLAMGLELQSSEPLISATINLDGTVIADDAGENISVTPIKVVLDAKGDMFAGGALKASLSSDVSANLKNLTVALNQLSLTSGDIAINGMAKLVGSHIDFDLKADEINIDKYLPPADDKAKAGSKAEDKAASNQALLPVEALRSLDIDGKISINKLIVSKLTSEQVNAHLLAKNGKITLKQKIGRFYQGSLDASSNINVTGKTPRINANANLQNLQAGPLFKDLTGEDKLIGTGRFKMNVNSSGNTLNALKKSLGGTLDFKFENGAVKGVNLAKLIRETKARFEGKSLPPSSEQEQTDFSELSGSAKITRGVLNNQDLQAKSPFLRVTGAGTVNLPKETLDYTVQARVVSTTRGQGGEDLKELEGLNIPVKLTGSYLAPDYKVDWGKILVSSQKAKVKEKVEEKIQEKLKGSLGDKLKGLF